MNRARTIRVFWYAINTLLIVSFLAILYGAAWEFSTENYLRGFADAIIPATDNPEQKTEAILVWISNGPARRSTSNPASLSLRDPADTLNFQQLLQVCGTATNAFLNLAQSSGMHARRLLLLSKDSLSKHVVAEVLIEDRWIVVDPAYHTVFHLPDGRLATRTDLEDPDNFRAVTRMIPNYPQNYTYEFTAHIRLERIPIIGRYLRPIFDMIWPSWEESFNWTLLVERESFAVLWVSIVLFFMILAVRFLFRWYCSSRLGISHDRVRDHAVRVGQVLARIPQ